MDYISILSTDTMHMLRRWLDDCDHELLTRVWDFTGEKTCPVCHQRPYFFWFYRCTIDSNGALPEADFMRTNSFVLNRDANLYTLSPSITKAAEQGSYTAEELEVLWKQKKAVRFAVQHNRPESSSLVSPNFKDQFVSILDSTTALVTQSLETEPGVGTELPSLRRRLQTIREIESETEEEYEGIDMPQLLGGVQLSARVACDFTCCHHCKPHAGEFSFQSLNKILETDINPLPMHEVYNKPFDPPLYRKIVGIRGSDRPLRAEYEVPTRMTRFELCLPTIVEENEEEEIADDDRPSLIRTARFGNLRDLVKDL